MSYYSDDAMTRNSSNPHINSEEERICARCKGLGEDRDGADCVFCEGYGSVIIR